MAIFVRWIVSTAASSLHAAAALLRGDTLADAPAAEALGAEIEPLRADLTASGFEPEPFFEHAIPLSVQFNTPARLVETVAAKIHGRDHVLAGVDRLAQRITALEAALASAHPRGIEELELRSEPIRQQWEARGPGLWAALGRLVEPELLASQADVILVQPVLGGGGRAHPLYNSVTLEAVLANPVAELPEVVRLGWLMAQLNLDLPKFEGRLLRDRALETGRVALVPLLLAAAEEVELARADTGNLARALEAWRLPPVDVSAIEGWWEIYRAERSPWPVAVGALDALLAGNRE